MKEIELINKRKPREKHFLQEDGTIVAKVYSDNIHYKKGKNYVEIDNDLIKEKGNYTNKSNEYKVNFPDEVSSSIMKMEKDNYYLDIKLVNAKKTKAKKKKKVSKYISELTYKDILDNIDIKYQNLPTKVKETIILNSKKYKRLIFEIFTNLQLIEKDNRILALEQDQAIFIIEKPYMQDSNGNKNTNIYYNLSKQNGYYNLELILDKKWLTSKDTKFPVYVDPTITNTSQETGLKDTYIYPGDEGVDKNSHSVLKAGIKKVNGLTRENRALIKFDLPKIGTGDQIISANLILTGYLPSFNHDIAEPKATAINKVTKEWEETTATWDNMSNAFDNKIEAIFESNRSSLDNTTLLPSFMYSDITKLVKKWYNGEENNGIMLQSVDKEYIDADYQAFFSKDNTVEGDSPKPLLEVTYRNQNGLEDYLDYKIQSFTEGEVYLNTYNGNITTIFELGNTVGGQLPANLSLIYNTNDVVLEKETSFGKGYKLNLEQTIKEETINETKYLAYNDADGTCHYFYPESNESNIYHDEDGLNLTIELLEDKCIMTDKYNNGQLIFNKNNAIYNLVEIKDANNNNITIESDENNRISKIKDRYNEEINITYNENQILITCPSKTTKLNLQNNKIISLETLLGTTTFTYNDQNIITSITDTTGIKIIYDYYDKAPYRVKKVTQYGLNNTLGQFFSIEYGFNTTRITNNQEVSETIIYNVQGNVLSRNSLKSNEDIEGAYSLTQEYGTNETNAKNKIISNQIPIGHVNNYLKNTSFESSENHFINEQSITSIISSDCANYGNNSLKITNSEANKKVTYQIDVPKDNYYTFSSYIKNDLPVEIILSYINAQGIEESEIEVIEPKETFEREDITILYPASATSILSISFKLLEVGTIYIDNIQLEKGEVANLYNFIENSDFKDGYSDWDYEPTNENLQNQFSIVKFNNDKNTALKVAMNPLSASSFSKRIPINGKKGDLFTISFWYKNEGIPAYRPHGGNYVIINFHPTDGEAEYCFAESPNLNSNDTIWQYYSHTAYAQEDFNEISFAFIQQDQANDFYVTNISVYHNVTSGFYEYDEKGNLVTVETQDKKKNMFSYDNNNKLIKSTNEIGENFNYEYDKVTNKIINSISSTGVSNRIIYNSQGNPIITKSINNINHEIVSGNYKIRAKGTNKYLKAELNLVLLEENSCSNTVWTLEKNADNGDYEIRYTANPNYLISLDNETVSLAMSKEKSIYLEQKEDYSYYIAVLTDNGVKYLKALENQLIIDTLDSNDQSFNFYIESQIDNFIEQNSKYTQDGKFIENIRDDTLNKIQYTTNKQNGQLQSMITSNNTEVEYEHNSKNQLKKIKSLNQEIIYEYNNANLLSSISQNQKIYSLEYDNFLRPVKTKLNNHIIFSENTYDQNSGNLIEVKYGNNATVNYEYDSYNRIRMVKKNNNTYKYNYNNNGNIYSIEANNGKNLYWYDYENRLYKYKLGNYLACLTYDESSNIKEKSYKLNNISRTQKFTFDKYLPIKTELEQNNITYSYDSLERLKNKNINNKISIEYEYLNYGKRTTDLIKSYTQNNIKYNYEYDQLKNIKKVYKDNQILKEYEYDELSQLKKEYNYDLGTKVEYTYDDSGNITNITKLDVNSNIVLETKTYEYQNNLWEDQLTKYNNDIISYDQIGNITGINNIQLLWNGKELSKYIDEEKQINVEYDYDLNGIRTTKKANGKITKYYTMDKDIIFEQNGEKLIYYLYDYEGLVGIEYNSTRYFYLKNTQNDIIGIVDDSGNLVVKYTYDSWGKIISVTDANDNVITDEENIGIVNPFRYRSYYYDNETKLYYLNNRYYNPEWGRFISADTILGANQDFYSNNLYLYVSNNPINNIDINGRIIKKLYKWGHKQLKKIKKTKAYKTISKVFNINASATIVNNLDVANVIGRTFGFDISNETGITQNKYISKTNTPFTLEINVSNIEDWSLSLSTETSLGIVTYSKYSHKDSSIRYQTNENSSGQRSTYELGGNKYSYYLLYGYDKSEGDLTEFSYERITVSKILIALSILTYGTYGSKVLATEVVPVIVEYAL